MKMWTSLKSAFRREQKANPIYQGMTMIDGMTQPRSMPRNYKSYSREGYGGNDTLYKVINYAITNGAAIPPVLFTDKTMSKRIEKHPILDKLERPNPEMTGVFFRKAVIGYFLISGNCFMYMNRVAKNGPPDELWTLPPDRVRPIPDQNRGIIGYEYEDWPKERNPIPPQLIGHLRTWNPEDPFFGMSPVQVAAIMIDQQTDARKWNLSLFQNFLKPPGAWTTTALLSPNERSKLEARINEKMAGFRNAGKVPLLDGALKFEPSAVNPSEMDWINSLKFNAGSIANIYNMPPQLIGDTSSTTYDNFEQAEVVSYTEFIFPALDDFYGLLNMWQVPLYPDLANSGAYLYYDKETVEVVQKVIQAQKDAQADRANKMWLSGLATQNEARELASLPTSPGGNVYRIGLVLVPADKLQEYAEQSLTAPAGPPMPQAEPLDVPAQPLQGNESENEQKPSADENKARKWATPDTAWIPEDLDERLDDYKDQGVTHVTWRLGKNPNVCPQCKKNNGVTVALGQPFPSGALLPQQHPNCDCTVEAMYGDEKARRRAGYKNFVEKVLV
jgi:HK97 family phage portal protein